MCFWENKNSRTYLDIAPKLVCNSFYRTNKRSGWFVPISFSSSQVSFILSPACRVKNPKLLVFWNVFWKSWLFSKFCTMDLSSIQTKIGHSLLFQFRGFLQDVYTPVFVCPLNFKHFVLPYLLHKYPHESHDYLYNVSVAGVCGPLSGVTRSFRKLCNICSLVSS